MDIRKLQRAIVDGLEDVKAQDIQVFNTEHLSPLFERVIVASGTSNRQTKSLAASVRDSVRTKGFSVMRTEGEENGEWIIVDCGAAVAHIMQPAIRQYYHLEELWGGKVVKMKFGDVKLGLVKAAEPDKPQRASSPAAPQRASSQAAPKRASSPAAPKRASSQAAPKRASPRAAPQRAPVKTAARKSTSSSPTRLAPTPAASTRAASPSRAPARKAAGAALPSSKRASAPSAARAPARTAASKSAPRAAGSGVVSRPTAKKSAPAKKTTRRA